MNVQHTPITMTERLERHNYARVPRRWIVLARVVWITLVILTLAIFFASLPAYEVGTAPYIFPRVLNTYQMSQAVVFGPLTVTPWGLSYREKTLPWTEMKSIKIDENYGQIAIKKQGKLFGWASVALSDLPNVEVFRMLVQHVTGVRP
jgi:hypothetical protein